MKILALISILISLNIPNVYGKENGFGPAGCGLGYVLFEGKEGLPFNVLAGIMNATSGTQTFGMSTGTLGCEDAKTAKVSAVSFIEANRLAFENDIARGNGKILEAYLILINENQVNVDILQANFDYIFYEGRGVSNSPIDVHKKILTLINS